MSISKRLNLEFPYDWSNAKMPEKDFIVKVLTKARFIDILKICAFYGTEKIEVMTSHIHDKDKADEIRLMLLHIKEGRDKALSAFAHGRSEKQQQKKEAVDSGKREI